VFNKSGKTTFVHFGRYQKMILQTGPVQFVAIGSKDMLLQRKTFL